MLDSFTQSSTELFFKCGELFRRCIMDDERFPSSPPAIAGGAVHKAIQRSMENFIIHGVHLPVEEVEDYARSDFEIALNIGGVFIPTDEARESNRILAEQQGRAMRFAKTYRERVLPTIKKPRVIEDRYWTNIGLPLPISGKLDLVDGQTIRDIKTSKNKWGKDKEHISLQPSFYIPLVRENLGGNYDFRYDILTENKDGIEIDSRITERDESDLEALKARLWAMYTAIERGDFLPATTIQGSWWCSPKYCAAYYTCKFISARLKGV